MINTTSFDFSCMEQTIGHSSIILQQFFQLNDFVQKGHTSLFGPIFTFCRIELIFGRLTCFDKKSIIA